MEYMCAIQVTFPVLSALCVVFFLNLEAHKDQLEYDQVQAVKLAAQRNSQNIPILFGQLPIPHARQCCIVCRIIFVLIMT